MDETIVNAFDAWVSVRGLTKRNAVRAAVTWIAAAPSQLRDLLVEGDVSGAAAWMDARNLDAADPAFDVDAFRRFAVGSADGISVAGDLDAAARDAQKRQRSRPRHA